MKKVLHISDSEELLFEDSVLEIGKGAVLREGNDVAIIASGIMVAPALEAAETLHADGIEARVIDMHTIKPLDEDIIVKAAEECGKIVTAEEHSVIGGLGGAVAEVTAQKCPCKVAMVGQHDVFGESGSASQLVEKYKLDGKGVYEDVKAFVK